MQELVAAFKEIRQFGHKSASMLEKDTAEVLRKHLPAFCPVEEQPNSTQGSVDVRVRLSPTNLDIECKRVESGQRPKFNDKLPEWDAIYVFSSQSIASCERGTTFRMAWTLYANREEYDFLKEEEIRLKSRLAELKGEFKDSGSRNFNLEYLRPVWGEKSDWFDGDRCQRESEVYEYLCGGCAQMSTYAQMSTPSTQILVPLIEFG